MANLKAVYERPLRTLDDLGSELAFFLRALAWTPKTVVRYKKEILRILAEVTLGSGALAVIGGTVGVITAMCFFTGTEVGLQGYAALNQIGTAAFSGFVSAYFNTREIAPLVAITSTWSDGNGMLRSRRTGQNAYCSSFPARAHSIAV
jgi:phospholipid/cholesterol/gamma-HCH transport system permease protein